VVLESAVFPRLIPAAWVPQAALSLLMLHALSRGMRPGLGLGLFLGLCVGALEPGPLGFWVGVYGLLGLAGGRLRSVVFPESLITQCLLPCAGVLIVRSILFAFKTPLGGQPGFFSLYLEALRTAPVLTTALVSPWLYRLYLRAARPRPPR